MRFTQKYLLYATVFAWTNYPSNALAAACSFPLTQTVAQSCDGLIVRAAQTGTVTNAGTIQNDSFFLNGIRNDGVITNLTNTLTGTITGVNLAIDNTGTEPDGTTPGVGNIGIIDNAGTIGAAIRNNATSTITTINNYAGGAITGGSGVGIVNWGTITTINNSGSISGINSTQNSIITTLNNNAGGTIRQTNGGYYGIDITATGGITNINNSGAISAINKAIWNNGTINSLTNSVTGLISSSADALSIGSSGTIGSLVNNGTINSTSADGIQNLGTITSINNTGTISGKGYSINNIGKITTGITNNGVISSLANAQGGASPQTVLSYSGTLPAYYSLIISSPTHYGQLRVASITGSMAFSINGISSVASGTTYADILQGFSSLDGITGTTGVFSGLGYSIVSDATRPGYWNLVFSSNSNNIPPGTTIDASSITGNPTLSGNTLVMNQNGQIYSNNFALSSVTSTIDQNGNTSTFTGIFSDAVYGQGGNLIIANSAAGGKVIFAGNNTYTGKTTINSGASLQIGNGGTSGNIIGNILNNGSLDFDRSDNLTYAGSISGTGVLTKLGAGALTLSGVNSYSGRTVVNSGILAINGSIAGTIDVQSGAQLQGIGSFGGGIINSGATIDPGNSIGTITSYGNLTFANGSIYRVETNAAGQSDKIIVNGDVKIDGGSVQINAAPGSYKPSQRYTIIQTTGNLSGAFTSISSNTVLLKPTLSYDDHNTYLTLDNVIDANGDTPFWLIARNINQYNVARSLTIAARASLTPQGTNLIDSILVSSAQSGQAILDTASGSGLAGGQSTAMQVGEMASSSVSDQIAFWRSGETMDATGVTSQEGSNPRSFLAYAPIQRNISTKGPIAIKGPAGSLTAAYAHRTFRAWGSMFGGGANYLSDAGRGAAASNIGYYGGLIGVDYQVQPNILLGIAVGGSSSNFNVGSLSTNGNLTGFHAGVYGAYTMRNSYIALNETFSAYNNQTSRKAGGYAYLPYEQLSAQFGSTEFRTRGELGHGILMGGLKATPFVAAEIAAYQSNAFSEQSSIYASTFALKNNGQGVNSLPTFAGLRLSNAVTLSNGWRLAPVGSVAYVHEFFPQRQLNNMLISMPGADFNVAGPRSTYNLVQTKVGVQLNLNEKLALFTDFQGEFSPVSQSYGGKGGVKYVW